jgi:hypothetical protein
MGKSTISMAIFNSFLLVYQRVGIFLKITQTDVSASCQEASLIIWHVAKIYGWLMFIYFVRYPYNHPSIYMGFVNISIHIFMKIHGLSKYTCFMGFVRYVLNNRLCFIGVMFTDVEMSRDGVESHPFWLGKSDLFHLQKQVPQIA